MFLSSFTLCNTSFVTRSVELVFSSLLQHHIPQLHGYLWSTFLMSNFQHHRKQCPKWIISLVSFWNVGQIFLPKKFFLGGGLNTVFAMAILNLISNVGLTSFVIRLPKYLKYSTFVLSENIKICQSRIENLDVITKGTLCTVAVLTFSNIFLQFSSAISTWASLIFLKTGRNFVITILNIQW